MKYIGISVKLLFIHFQFPDLLRKPTFEQSPYYDYFVFRHYDLKLLLKVRHACFISIFVLGIW